MRWWWDELKYFKKSSQLKPMLDTSLPYAGSGQNGRPGSSVDLTWFLEHPWRPLKTGHVTNQTEMTDRLYE